MKNIDKTKNKVVVILGPTATGKTDIGLKLARKFNGELVACDSRQVYKDLDIGTGKMPGGNHKIEKKTGYWLIDEIPVYLYDVVPFDKQYSVKEYVEDASNKVESILIKGKLPIIVGGTGLYLRALLSGLDHIGGSIDKKLREDLNTKTLEEVQAYFKQNFSNLWSELNTSEKNNKRRLIRKIELNEIMYPYNNTDSDKFTGLSSKYVILKIGLSAPRSVLNQRIDTRILSRIDQGMIDESRVLHERGLSYERMESLGLEYRILSGYLKGLFDKKDLVEVLKVKIHQYAKRQITWFKKEKDVEWFDITVPSWDNKVEKRVSIWYYSIV